MTNIIGMDRVTERVDFEKKVIGGDGNTKRIDVYVPETRVIIEQKSLGIALDKPQAGHDGMTPYEQAKMYDNYLPFDEQIPYVRVKLLPTCGSHYLKMVFTSILLTVRSFGTVRQAL